AVGRAVVGLPGVEVHAAAGVAIVVAANAARIGAALDVVVVRHLAGGRLRDALHLRDLVCQRERRLHRKPRLRVRWLVVTRRHEVALLRGADERLIAANCAGTTHRGATTRAHARGSTHGPTGAATGAHHRAPARRPHNLVDIRHLDLVPAPDDHG